MLLKLHTLPVAPSPASPHPRASPLLSDEETRLESVQVDRAFVAMTQARGSV